MVIFLRGIKRSRNFYNFFSGGGKKKRILKPLLRLRGFRGVCIRTNTDFYRHIGNRINAEKCSTKEKKPMPPQSEFPKLGAERDTKGISIFRIHILLCLFLVISNPGKGDCSLLEPTSSKGRGGTIRTCSKSEQQFERRRRRLVFPEKKNIYGFSFREEQQASTPFSRPNNLVNLFSFLFVFACSLPGICFSACMYTKYGKCK